MNRLPLNCPLSLLSARSAACLSLCSLSRCLPRSLPGVAPRPTATSRAAADAPWAGLCSGDLARFWLSMPASAHESGAAVLGLTPGSPLFSSRVEAVAGGGSDARAPRPPTRNLFPIMRQRKHRLVNPFSRRSLKKWLPGRAAPARRSLPEAGACPS